MHAYVCGGAGAVSVLAGTYCVEGLRDGPALEAKFFHPYAALP